MGGRRLGLARPPRGSVLVRVLAAVVSAGTGPGDRTGQLEARMHVHRDTSVQVTLGKLSNIGERYQRQDLNSDFIR